MSPAYRLPKGDQSDRWLSGFAIPVALLGEPRFSDLRMAIADNDLPLIEKSLAPLVATFPGIRLEGHGYNVNHHAALFVYSGPTQWDARAIRNGTVSMVIFSLFPGIEVQSAYA